MVGGLECPGAEELRARVLAVLVMLTFCKDGRSPNLPSWSGCLLVINGEKATLETPTFAQKRQRTLDMLIRSLYQDLMPDMHKVSPPSPAPVCFADATPQDSVQIPPPALLRQPGLLAPRQPAHFRQTRSFRV